MSEILRHNKFSLIIDETTDIGTKKCLALVVRYFDQIKGKVRDRFLSMLELRDCDATSLHKVISDLFVKYNIPLSNIVGFASDNASVMTGWKSGVRTHLKNQNLYLFVMGCICHSLHLCSSSRLPRNLDKFTKNVYNYFAHSTKKLIEFQEIQEMFSVNVHKILKTSSTHWLTLGNVINRIFEQWTSFTQYLIVSQVESDDDLGKKIFSELPPTNE